MTPGSWLVLREGTKQPIIRGDYRSILEHVLQKRPEEWKALQPEVDKDYRIIGFKSAVNTLFSMDGLLQQYRGAQLTGLDSMTKQQKDALEVYKGLVGK